MVTWTNNTTWIGTGLTLGCLVLCLSSCGGSTGEGASLSDGETVRTTARSMGLAEALAETEALQCPAGVDAEVFSELQVELKRVLQEQGTQRFVSSAPDSPASAVNNLMISHIPDGSADLRWTYKSQGDGDLNSEVNIADLTPLGVHLKKTSQAADWSRASNTDNDLNGEVNISDITPIGVNFFNRVEGYWLQRSSSADGPWNLESQILFDTSSINPENFHREFMHHLEMPVDGNYYRVAPYDSGDIGIPSNAVQVDSFVLPGRPENLSATQGTLLDAVELSWDAVADVEYYEIQRRTGNLGNFEFLADTPDNGTGYTDEAAISGEHYTYIVRGWTDYKKTDFSNEAEGWSMEFPIAPANLSASDGTSAAFVSLSWDAIANASEYVVYHSLEEAGTFSEIDRTEQPGYDDTAAAADVLNWYYVTASNFLGESPPSNTDSGYLLGALPIVESISPLRGLTKSSVLMSALTSGAAPLSWSWDFALAASPGTSSDPTPTITLGDPGVYNCSLTLEGSFANTVFNFQFEVQSDEWTHTLGSAGPDHANKVGTDNEGNVYVFGRVGGQQQLFVARFDPAGNLDWAKLIITSLDTGGISGSVAANGDVFVATALGYSSGDPPASTGVLNFKLNSDGELRFSKVFDNADPQMMCQNPHTAIGDDGKIYVAYSANIPPEREGLLVSYVLSPVGGLEMYGYYETPSYFPHKHSVVEALAIDSSGNLYLTGDEANVIKLDTVGDIVWCKGWGNFEAVPHEHPYCLNVDSSGNVYLGGGAGSEEFDYQPFLVKFDSSGTIIWQKGFSLGADTLAGHIYRMDMDEFGNSYCLIPEDLDQDIPSRFLMLDSSGETVRAWEYSVLALTNKIMDLSYFNGKVQMIGYALNPSGTWQSATCTLSDFDYVPDDRTATRIMETGSLFDVVGLSVTNFIGELDLGEGQNDLLVMSRKLSNLP